MTVAVAHMRLRLDGEYLAYVVMRQALAEIRDTPWVDGARARELASLALEAEGDLAGRSSSSQEDEGDARGA